MSGPDGLPRPAEAADARTRAGPAPGTAAGDRGRLWRIKTAAFVVLVVMLAADLVSKGLLQDALGLRPGQEGERTIDVLPGFFALQGTWNPGVTFGMARGYTLEILVLTGVATLALLTWLIATRQSSRLLHIGLGLILSGALGNLYDRIRWSEVRDFFLIYLGQLDKPSWTWPNFNVADACIVVGVGLVIFDALFGAHPAVEKPGSGA